MNHSEQFKTKQLETFNSIIPIKFHSGLTVLSRSANTNMPWDFFVCLGEEFNCWFVMYRIAPCFLLFYIPDQDDFFKELETERIQSHAEKRKKRKYNNITNNISINM